MQKIVNIQISSDGENWKNIACIQDGSIDLDPPSPKFKCGLQKLEWTATLDEGTAMLIYNFLYPQRKKKTFNLVKRLAARAIINAAFQS